MAINVEAFYDAINNISRRQIESTAMDLTIEAKIVKLVIGATREYQVNYQQSLFSAFALDDEVSYSPDETVYVLVPGGNFSAEKMILGRSGSSSTSTADRQKLEQIWVPEGPNWVGNGDSSYPFNHLPLQICAVPYASREQLVHIKDDDQTGANWEDIGFLRYSQFDGDESEDVQETINLTHQRYKKEMEDLMNAMDSSVLDDPSVMNLVRQKVINMEMAPGGASVSTTRYPTSYPTSEELTNIDNLFQNYSKVYDHIMISGIFRTDFNAPHSLGSYALRATFIANNPAYVEKDSPMYENIGDQPKYIFMSFDLGFKDFSGNPYSMPVGTPQTAYFPITPGTLQGLYRLSLYQDGNFLTDIIPTYDEENRVQYVEENAVLNKNNIYVEKVNIQFCRKIDLNDGLYHCWIETPRGNNLYDGTENVNGVGSVDLVPHLYYQGEEVTKDARILWFRQDLSVSVGTPTAADRDEYNNTWVDYLDEPWWRPIEQLMEEPGDIQNSFKLYDISDNGTLTVLKSAVPWRWTYRCVCAHEGKALAFDDCDVSNLNSKYDLFIEKLTSPTSDEQQLRVSDWGRDPETGALIGKVGHLLYPEAVGGERKFYPEYFADWYVQTTGNMLEPIAKMRHGPRDITAWANESAITFWAAAYDPFQISPGDPWTTNYDNLTQRAPIGYVKFSELRTEDLEMSFEWVGDTSFNYTTQGFAYPGVAGVEKRLQPKIHWLLGEQHQHPFIYLKTGGTRILLGGRNYINPAEKVEDFDTNDEVEITGYGFDPPGSMMEHIWVDQENVIHFYAKPQFDDTALDNTFVAVAHLIANDEFYESEMTVAFNFDGQQGTQGTEWRAVVEPTNTKDHYRKQLPSNSMQLLSQATMPFTSQLGLQAYPITVVKKGAVWEQSEKSLKVVIRPFCYKGKDLINSAKYGEAKHYRIRARYDARYPQSCRDTRYRYMSFLRFYHCGDDNKTGMYLNSEVNGMDTANLNPKGEEGMVAETWWWGDASEKERQANSIYNAVEVKFKDPSKDNPELQDALVNMRYNFVVKCQIDIYTDKDMEYLRYDKTSGLIKTKNTGNAWHLVKNFVVYYPVDVFFAANEDVRFNPRYCSINWPREIIYNSTGHDPINWTRPLEMYYGYESVTQREDYGEFIKPVSLTPDIHKVDDQGTYYDSEHDTIDAQGNIIKDGNLNSQADDSETPSLGYGTKSRFQLVANESLSWQNGMVGTLYGEMHGVHQEGAPDGPDIPRGVFYRNQVFVINSYGNVDINGWDGMGIDVDEDNGTIFAPTIGAGFKNPYSNKFTGVLMGVNKEYLRITRNNSKNPNNIMNVYNDCISQGKIMGVGPLSGEYVEDVFTYPYMTGLFGYQEGVASFGLLENGTAFFGRSDRGARIIIDGNNAVIYGGINGEFTDPEIGDPMWNGMRLTLADLTGATGAPEVGGHMLGYSNAYYGGEHEDSPWDVYHSIGRMPQWYKWTWQGAYFHTTKRFPPYWLRIKEGYASYNDTYDKLIAPNDDPDGGLKYVPIPQSKFSHYYDGTPTGDGPYNQLITSPNDEDMFIDYWIPDPGSLETYLGDLLGKMQENIDNATKRLNEIKKELDEGNIKQEEFDKKQREIERLEQYKDRFKKESFKGFSPNHASTTPAIEIGQHPPGLMPGILPWGTHEKIFNEIFIPGDRNFMVTYDGTMWAMNGVFLGNIIGSNIVGGRIQGSEIGLGEPRDGEVKVYTPDLSNFCGWDALIPPKLMEYDFAMHVPGQFYADNSGRLFASKLFITGGGIDLGSFHIVPTYELLDDGTLTEMDDEYAGALIQMGHSDFIGPTHFYGNVGIGMNLAYDQMNHPELGYPYKGSGASGNLFQTNGLVALGIPLPDGGTELHQKYANISSPWDMDVAKSFQYSAPCIKIGDPMIETKVDTVERTSFFGLSTVGLSSAKKDRMYRGHFWPVAFRYKKTDTFTSVLGKVEDTGVHAYFQLMDIFKSKALEINNGDKSGSRLIEGGNYFRVGPWGPEFDRAYLCEGWQDEEKSNEPIPTRKQAKAKGFFGMISRDGIGNDKVMLNMAVGMETWDSTTILIRGDAGMGVRIQDQFFFDCYGAHSAAGDKYDKNFKTRPNVLNDCSGGFVIGDGFEVKMTEYTKRDNRSSVGIRLGLLKKGALENNVRKVATNPPNHVDPHWQSGLCLYPNENTRGSEHQGTFLFQRNGGKIHIMAGDFTNHKTNDTSVSLVEVAVPGREPGPTRLGYSEIYLSENEVRATADEAWSICLGNNAHAAYNGCYRIGMDATSSAWVHRKHIEIFLNAEGTQSMFGENITPGLLLLTDSIGIYTIEGSLKGIKDKVGFYGAWENPENQINIFARFG